MSSDEREFSIEVIRVLRDAGFEALWAGGCVRDSLLGREPGDYDVATSARPEQVKGLFKRTLNVGAAFGVMIVLGSKREGQIEVATFRADGEYLDGRRPEGVTFCSAEQDALRRDFTVNGMFFDPMAEEVIDYVGGQADLKREVIRAIGNPGERFEEDKLRLLRAVRFAARYDFAVEEETSAAIRKMASQLNVVSAERIAQELRKMLKHPNRRLAMQLAREHQLLQEIFPELNHADDSAWQSISDALDRLSSESSFEIGLATVLQSLNSKLIAQVCRRLRLANKETDAVTWLIAQQDSLTDAASLELAKLKRLLAEPLILDLLEFLKARAIDTDTADVDFCKGYLERTPAEVINPPMLLTGDDLIAAGFEPGPGFKPLLDSVRDAQLNGEVETSEDALTLARSLTQ
jgi:poly(A) polymerase